MVNIGFNAAKVNAKTLTYNEIYTPIFKRKKNKIKIVDWQMTKNYSHYKFEQKIFKKDFIIMNKKLRPKLALASFVYDIIDVFRFADDATRGMYSQNSMIKCLPYQLLIDTNSTSFFTFLFVSWAAT